MIMTSWPKKKSSAWLRQRVCFLNFQIKKKLKILNDHDHWPSKYLVLARCVVFIRFDYTLIAEDSLGFLFWSQKKRVRERKEKKKKRKQKMLEWYIFLVKAVDLKPQKTEEVACVAGPRKNGRARGRHAKGEGGPALKAHENRSTRILWVWIFPIVREAPEGKINRAGRENCQSIVHGQRSEGLILRHQLLEPLNGIIGGGGGGWEVS